MEREDIKIGSRWQLGKSFVYVTVRLVTDNKHTYNSVYFVSDNESFLDDLPIDVFLSRFTEVAK
ncbi:hypothetical protein [Psychrobacter glacincola]|uniref:hypothetical protein n=1 Tax=Psychrobacter glacincola TaxID=56810 RepID=UPI0039B03067